MTRFKRLENWPECLSKMTVEQLRNEIVYWQTRAKFLGHPSAKKEAMKRARQVERILERKLTGDEQTEQERL